MTCHKEKCVKSKIETCSSHAECRGKYGRNFACVKNVCRKIKTGCRRDDDCPKGRKFVELKGKLSFYSITIIFIQQNNYRYFKTTKLINLCKHLKQLILHTPLQATLLVVVLLKIKLKSSFYVFSLSNFIAKKSFFNNKQS